MLTLGNLYWECEKYADAQRCYGTAIGLLDKDRKDYQQLSDRSKVLDELVPHTNNIELQDSLQRLAKMPEDERNKVIDKIIEELIKKEPENKQAYFEQFVDIQLEILSKKCPLLNRLKEKMNRKISMADIDATTRYELHTRLNGMPNADQVCHGDFDLSNVIISENGPYIIDWAHVTQGNPEADAARTYLRFWLSGNIQGAERYLDVFCNKSSIEKQMIQRWMPIVATSQSVKSKPTEREFLLSWANVVEYQ